MFSTLVIKEFRFITRKEKSGSSAWNFLSGFLINLALIALLSFIFYILFGKIKDIGDGTANPFGKAATAMFTICLGLTSLVYFFIYLSVFKKVFYEEDDQMKIKPLPLKTDTLLLSKLTVVFLKALSDFGLVELGLMISFGIVTGQGFVFYVFALLSDILSVLFVLFFDLLLSRPFKKLTDWLNDRIWLTLGAAVLVSGLAGTAYFLLLLGVLKIIGSQNISNIFSVDNLKVLTAIASYLIPVNGLVSLMLIDGNFLFMVLAVLICLGAIPGLIWIGRTYFQKGFDKGFDKDLGKKGEGQEKPALKWQKHPFIIKETIRSIRESKSGFSSFALLLLVPLFSFYLGYLLQQVFILFGLNSPMSMQALIDNGASPFAARVISHIPQYKFPLTCYLISFFMALVFSAGNDPLEGEREAMGVLLTIPVSFQKQIIIKYRQNLLLSGLTALLAFVVLAATSTCSLLELLFLLLICLSFTWAGYFYSEARNLGQKKLGQESAGGLIFIMISGLLFLLLDFVLVNLAPDSFSKDGVLAFSQGIVLVLSFGLLILSYFYMKKNTVRFVSAVKATGGKELA